jgi:hypothetical protein
MMGGRAPARRPLRVALCVVAGLLAAEAAPVRAQSQTVEATPSPVSLRVRVVQAGEQKGAIDPDCEDLPRILGPMKFGSLKVVQDRHLRLQLGEKGLVSLPTGDEVQMQPISIIQQQLFMHVQAPKINGSLRMRRGQPIVVGGRRHKDGHLIVYIVPEF